MNHVFLLTLRLNLKVYSRGCVYKTSLRSTLLGRYMRRVYGSSFLVEFIGRLFGLTLQIQFTGRIYR